MFKILKIEEPIKNVFIAEMAIKGRKVFSHELLEDLMLFFKMVKDREVENNENKFFVFKGEEGTGVFNYGGDLLAFLDYIENEDIDSLKLYGKICVDLIYAVSTATEDNITTIAIINGETRGGGLESAIACDIVIAEEGYTVSLPEQKYGFFPGMGAYEFLTRKIGHQKAKEFILRRDSSFKTEELVSIGLFDYLTEQNKSTEKLFQIIKEEKAEQSKYNGFRKIYKKFNPIEYKTLIDSVNIWAESISLISETNRKKMRRVINIQGKNNEK